MRLCNNNALPAGGSSLVAGGSGRGGRGLGALLEDLEHGAVGGEMRRAARAAPEVADRVIFGRVARRVQAGTSPLVRLVGRGVGREGVGRSRR